MHHVRPDYGDTILVSQQVSKQTKDQNQARRFNLVHAVEQSGMDEAQRKRQRKENNKKKRNQIKQTHTF